MSDSNFLTLKDALTLINVKRAEKGLAQINQSDWSAFLSGTLGKPVRKAWLKELTANRSIREDKALAVLASINAALKQINQPLLKATVLQKINS